MQQKEFLSFCSFLVREAMLVSYKSQNLTSFISSSDFKTRLSPFIHSHNLIEIIDLIEDFIIQFPGMSILKLCLHRSQLK